MTAVIGSHRRIGRLRLERSRSRLRVAVVAESYLPAVNGVSNSVLRVAEHMTTAGHEVLVIAPAAGDGTEATVDVSDDFTVVRVPSLELPRYPDLMVGRPSRVVTSALKAFRPDVVHVAAPVVLGLIALRAARRLDIPSVAVYQTDLAGFASRYRMRGASAAVWRWLAWVHGQADITLAPSTSATWDLRERGVDRVGLWMRGVDTEQFHPRHRDDALRAELGDRGDVLVGYVGRLAKEKQVHRLAAVAAHPGVSVVVVGDGPARAELERALPRATFTGFRCGSDLGRHVASLDVFVHTGLDETFCQAVQEALAAGVPVVAPAAGGPLDLVRHGQNGYLWSPESESSLPGAVAELVSSPVLREQMGHAARESVTHRTWPAVMDELEGHYRAAMSGLGFAYSTATHQRVAV